MKRHLTRRTRWIHDRALRRRDRPRPLVVRNANAASVTYKPRRVQRIWQLALHRRGPWGTPDLVLATEMADINAATDLPAGWTVHQVGPVGSASSALAVAAGPRVTLEDVELLPGTAATSEGGGIRDRPILRGRAEVDAGTPQAWAFTWAVGHAPPARAPRARARYLDEYADVPAQVKAGDLNVLARAMARVTGWRRVHSTGVLHTAVPRWIPSRSTRRSRHVGVESDHPAQDIRLWPSRR